MPVDSSTVLYAGQRTKIDDTEAQFGNNVEASWVEVREQTSAPATPTDKPSCLLYALTTDHRLRAKLSDGTVLDLTLAGAGPLSLKGAIAAAANFPPAEGAAGGVENGWFYYVTADVTDNAGAGHTNTGQHFLAGSAIAWVHATLSWLDVSEQVNVQYIAATPGAIGTGDVVAAVNVAGAAVVTLPAAAVGIVGKKISVHDVRGDKAIGTVIAITPNGTDTIDGVNAAVNIDTPYGGYELICVQTGAGPATYGWTTIVGAEIKTAIVDRDFAGATLGHMVRTGVGTYAVVLDNMTAIVPPNPAVDDATAGYGVGSRWVDTVLDNTYECADPAAGAAVWRLTLNAAAAGGELAGAYPNPTVADDVIDAANCRAGALAGVVVNKGVPSSCVIAFDNAAGAAQRPADGASYTFSIGGVPFAAIEARDVVVDQYDFLRSSAGAEEADTILMATAFAACINANTVIGPRIRAEVYSGAGDGRWYVQCYTRLQADITAGSALTCVLGGGQPGVYQARATAVVATKTQFFPFTYAVTAQDVLAGQIEFSFGCTAVLAYEIDILTAVGNYARIGWTGNPAVIGGTLVIDNAGGATDWAAGNVIRGWLIGTVA